MRKHADVNGVTSVPSFERSNLCKDVSKLDPQCPIFTGVICIDLN